MLPKKLPRGIDIVRFKLKDGTEAPRYRARVYWQYKQISVGTFDELKFAKAARDKAQLEVINGTFIPPKDRRRMHYERLAAEQAKAVTVAQWSEQWLEGLESNPERAISPNTISTYRTALKHIIGPLGSLSLSEVTEAQISAIVASLRSSKPATARSVTRVAKSMFNAAIDAEVGGLTANPAARIKAPAARARQDDEVPELSEVKRIAAAMPEDLRLAVYLAAVCALRLGECLGLQRGDLDLDAPAGPDLYVRRQWLARSRPPAYSEPKSGSARAVAIPSQLVPMIRKHLANMENTAPDAPLFPLPKDNTRPIGHDAFRVHWRKAREGIRPGLAFHSLRHFGSTAYNRAGGTSVETGKRLGQRSPEVIVRYQHGSRVRDHEIAERMGKRLNLGDLLG